MATEQRHDITLQGLTDLSNRLHEFSDKLSAAEKTMLTAILVLAGKQLASEQSEVHGFGGTSNVQVGSRAGLQQGFSSSFSRFAPGAIKAPPRVDPSVNKITVCIE